MAIDIQTDKVDGTAFLVLSKTVTLTDDQIKTLPTIPVEIVPAQGANKIIYPIAAHAIFDMTGGIYTGETNASWSFLINTQQISTAFLAENSLVEEEPVVCIWQFPLMFVGSGVFTNLLQSDFLYRNDSINQPITLRDIVGGVANYGGGNAANSLIVTVFYTIIEV